MVCMAAQGDGRERKAKLKVKKTERMSESEREVCLKRSVIAMVCNE